MKLIKKNTHMRKVSKMKNQKAFDLKYKLCGASNCLKCNNWKTSTNMDRRGFKSTFDLAMNCINNQFGYVEISDGDKDFVCIWRCIDVCLNYKGE